MDIRPVTSPTVMHPAVEARHRGQLATEPLPLAHALLVTHLESATLNDLAHLNEHNGHAHPGGWSDDTLLYGFHQPCGSATPIVDTPAGPGADMPTIRIPVLELGPDNYSWRDDAIVLNPSALGRGVARLRAVAAAVGVRR
jgi:hypothetical protein